VLVKGIVRPDDAERVVAEGADGVIVSNHGGRTLDGLPAAIDLLEPIAAPLEDAYQCGLTAASGADRM
jgi:4-hydroxymandelate oxidase